MLNRIGMLVLVVVVMTGVFPAVAQDSTTTTAENAWTVSLYEQSTGKVTRVSLTGEVIEEITLPLPEGFDTFNYDALSADGRYIAYVVSKVGDGSNPVQESKLVVYDTNMQMITATYDLNPGVIREGINAASSSLHFSEDGTQVIMAYDVPVAGGENQWTMDFVVIDAATGELVNQATSEMMAAAGINSDAPYRMKVIAFRNSTAIMQLYPIFSQISPDTEVVNWDVVTQEISPAPMELINAAAYNPATGEALVLAYDASINTPAEGEMQTEDLFIPPNTVQLFNVNTGTLETIYTEDVSIISAKFVQNGERILLFADAGARGILIERDGTVLSEFPNLPGDYLAAGTPDGFVYADPESSQAVIVVRTRDNDFTSNILYTPTTPYTMLWVVMPLGTPGIGG